jgi:mannose-6-phosphate isomerase-like protein (cupin superfamily)
MSASCAPDRLTAIAPFATSLCEETAMPRFETMRLAAEPTEVAPDGSDVRVLLRLGPGGLAHFELGPGQVSKATRHRTVEEIWYFVGGRGQMWRRQGDRTEIVDVDPGTCLTIPLGTDFQFRALGFEPLAAIGATMPNWPGPDEAIQVEGCPDW